MAFEKGQSGNPGGRPKTVARVRKWAGRHTRAAIRVLSEIMEDTGQHPAARVAAARELLDRAHGKPMQAHELSGTDGGPIQTEQVERLTAEQLQRVIEATTEPVTH